MCTTSGQALPRPSTCPPRDRLVNMVDDDSCRQGLALVLFLEFKSPLSFKLEVVFCKSACFVFCLMEDKL